MAYRIDKSNCLQCGTCAGSCPVNAISEDYDSTYVINPVTCLGCGCCASVCPANAIYQE